jgi:hypothetical protein
MMMRIVPLKMLRLLVGVSRLSASSVLKRRLLLALLIKSRNSSQNRSVESVPPRAVETVAGLVELSPRLTLNS